MTADLVTEAEKIRQQIDCDIDAEDKAASPGTEYAIVDGELKQIGGGDSNAED